MMDMDNDQIVKQLPNLEKRRATLCQKEKALAKLIAEVDDLENEIATLDKVAEVYDGVALDIWDFGDTTIDAVDYANKRSASVYQNAHNEWSWGLKTYTYNPKKQFREEKWHGAGFPDYDEVMKFAKEWVANGKLPEYEAFHTIDQVLEN